MKREKIGEQLARLRAFRSKRDMQTGQLYERESERKKAYSAITLYGIFVSDEETFLIRPHIFDTKKPRTPEQWEAWLAVEYGAILRDAILPGMGARTGKFWRLYRVIGWIAGARGLPKNPAARNARRSSKR